MISDFDLPTLNGGEVLDQIYKINHEIKLTLLSNSARSELDKTKNKYPFILEVFSKCVDEEAGDKPLIIERLECIISKYLSNQ